MSKTLFTKIIEGEIPSYKIYETPFVFALLDIHPMRPGHVLVVPKFETDHFDTLPEPFYSAVFQAAKLIAQAQKKAFGVQRVTLQIHGFEVPHVHVHIIPVNTMEEGRITLVEQASKESLTDAQKRILSHLL